MLKYIRPHQNKKWTTKDGTKIRIRDMSTTHIENCLNMLRRMHVAALNVDPSMMNGEQAMLSVEQGIDALIEDGPEGQFEEIWFDLEDELNYRKVNDKKRRSIPSSN